MLKNVMIVKIELAPCFGGELCLDWVEQWLTTQVHNRAIIVTDVTDKVEAMEDDSSRWQHTRDDDG